MWLQLARVLVGVMMVLTVCNAEAAWWEKEKRAKPPQSPAAAPAPVKTPEEVAQERLTQDWLERLKGTTWSLELRLSSGESGGPQQDTLSFGDRRVASEALQQEGYGGSNFTLTAQDDQAATWETMQVKAGGDTALWRAEIRGTTMSGVLSKRPAQGEPATWSFTGTQRAAPVPASLPAQEIEGQAEAEPGAPPRGVGFDADYSLTPRSPHDAAPRMACCGWGLGLVGDAGRRMAAGGGGQAAPRQSPPRVPPDRG